LEFDRRVEWFESGGDNMLYALVDCSGKRSLRKIYAEEMLGEVKVVVPKFTEKNGVKYAKLLIKKIDSYKVQNVLLSKNIENNADFHRVIEENRKYIVTGKRMGKAILPKIMNEISKYTRYPKEKMSVLLLMNEYSLENIELVEWISSEIKQLNVLSRNYSKYEKSAKKLFNEFGYVVNLYNNDEIKEFKRVNVVINIDFKEDELKKINFAKNSVVVSLNEKIDNLKKGFNGIIINDVDIAGNFDDTKIYRKLALCEAKIYKPLRNLKENNRIFNTEKYIINGYIGKRGKITVEEFEKVGKTFA
jgi:hypothetical protein